MKKILLFAENYILLLASLTLGLFLLLLADKAGGFSEKENRNLQPFPELSASSLASGRFMEEFEKYLSDAFPARGEMIALSNTLTGVFGETDKQAEARKTFDAELGMIGDEAPETSAAPLSTPAEDPAAETQSAALPAAQAQGAALWFVRRDGGKQIIEEYTPQTVAYVAGVVNRYREALGENGRVFLVNSPASDVANEVLDSHRYADWGYDMDEAMQPLLSRGAKIYSVPKILEPWRDEGAMFSTSDLHWYVKTAWRVSNAFLDDLGYAPTGFYDYEYYLRDSLRSGPFTPEQLQSMTIDRENLMVPRVISPVRASIVTHLTEKAPTELYDFVHHGYTMYLGGAKGPYRLFETGFHTGRNALIISDSYAFAMAYYLFPYYDSVLQTDLRNANYNVSLVGASIRDYMEQYDIDDVYIITCQWTSFNGPVFSWRLERFLDSAAVS